MAEVYHAINDESSETEDLLLSESEDVPYIDNRKLLSIDSNARIVSNQAHYNNVEGDNCDMHSVEKDNSLLYHKSFESKLDTSTEELDVSDDENLSDKHLTLQCVNMDGIACISSRKNADSVATLNYSSTVFKDENFTDAEYISDDETSGSFKEKINEGMYKKFSPGLSVSGFTSAVKSVSSVVLSTNQKTLNKLNIKNAYIHSLLIEEKDLINLWEEPQSPLMTCLEFLKTEVSDENNTDAEDISIGSLDEDGIQTRNFYENCDLNIPLENEVPTFENQNRMACLGDSRRSSIVEFLTEDETFNMDNSYNSERKRLKKRNIRLVEKSDVSDEFTDEEYLDDDKEWTETDESGGVRQITQIKTETSIKLEGEGGDLDIDGDDTISRRTTTTTRIITTVTTDGEEETHSEQQVEEDGDDLRHSVEVILNQFMSSDAESIKPEDSTTEHDE